MARKSRFYEDEFPKVDDLVVVKVASIDNVIGAYVRLVEYGDSEALITMSEVSKRRIRSLNKLLKIGSEEVCMVTSVDEEKRYINLSKKRVITEDIAPKLENFARAKNVHGIMTHVAFANELDPEDLCAKVSWKLNGIHKSAYDAFRKHMHKEIDVWKDIDFSAPGKDLSHMGDKLRADIEKVLERRFVMAQVRLQAKCEVSCSGYEGIDAVKESLVEGYKVDKDKEDIKVNIQLIAHPLFALTCTCADKEEGVKILDDAMGRVEKAILAKGGAFALKSKPTFILKEKEEGEEEEGEGSESESGSASENQDEDETMGELDEAELKALMARKVDDGDDD